MPSAFVTGATGFVGMNLVDELLRQGFQVTALHRRNSNIEPLRRLPVSLAEGEITEPASLRRAIPASVDVVFHVAGNTNLWSRQNAEQTRDNVDGTRNVVETALDRSAKKLILTSSISAYGQQSGEVTEATPSNAADSWINYQRTKWLAEQEVHKGIKAGLPAVIMNPGAIIGPYDTSGWARLFSIVAEHRLPGALPGEISAAHVHEVVKAHIAAVERGRTGENYLLAGTPTSFLEMLTIIAELLGKPPPRRVIRPSMVRFIARVQAIGTLVTGKRPQITPEVAALSTRAFTCPSRKARQELGFKIVPIRTMLQDCYDWLVATGKLKVGHS